MGRGQRTMPFRDAMMRAVHAFGRAARRPRPAGQAGERALRGPGEQVVAGGQHGRSRRGRGRGAERHQFSQPLPGDISRAGQAGERQRPAGEQRADPAEAQSVVRRESRDARDRAVGHRNPRGPDQVLAGRVVRVPRERRVEQLRREVHDRFRAVAHGGAGRDHLKRRGAFQRNRRSFLMEGLVLETAQQHADFLGFRPVVDVGLVEDHEPPVAAVRALEQVHVCRAKQQVLQHRVVGEQQVRRGLAHLGAGQQLVREPGLARVERVEERRAFGGPLRRLAGVPAERDVRRVRQHLPQAAHLVVGEGVHRVQQEGTDAGAERAGFALFDERGQDREQEALRLARAGPGRDDQVAAGLGLPDRLLLVRVQRPVKRQRGAAEPGEPAGQDAFADQVAQARPGLVRRRRLQHRSLGQQRAAVDRVPQRPREVRVPDGQQRPQVAAVGQAQVLGGGDDIHNGRISYYVVVHGSLTGLDPDMVAIVTGTAAMVMVSSAWPWAVTVSRMRRSG